MDCDHHKAMVYLFEKILPTITDEKIDIYSRQSRCIHCCNFDGKEELETNFLQIYIDKQKECDDVIWVLNIKENCIRCKSYSNETIKLKYITRNANYEIIYPTRFEEEHILSTKCKNCDSNLYYGASECAGSGSSHEFCKKCGFTGMSTFWD